MFLRRSSRRDMLAQLSVLLVVMALMGTAAVYIGQRLSTNSERTGALDATAAKSLAAVRAAEHRHGDGPSVAGHVPAAAGQASARRPASGKAEQASPQHPVANAPVPTRRACAEKPKKGYASCLAKVRTDVTGHKGTFGANFVPNGYGPADLQSAYALASASPQAGSTVAIVDAFDDPSAEQDLAVYRQQYGLPACTSADGCFSKVDQRGGTSYPTPDSGWAEEISLDVDMVSAVCPGCHILLVESDNNTTANLGTAVNEAVKLGAKFVSNSYGGGEDPSETTFDSSYFDHPGVAITASSGDGGYGVEYPAASPHVTAVGGTSLTRNANNSRGWDETAWDGAGSGCSAVESKPSWQKDSGCANKAVADVSAVADPATGVAVYDTFQTSGWGVVGGTSVASPVIASTYALGGTPASGSYPVSTAYDRSASLNDVTSGSNGSCTPSYLCTAGPGYDGPTGLGTPNGVGAFTGGPHGDVVGTVTDAAGGKPLSGALVSAGDFALKADAQGHFDLSAPPGTYDLKVSAYGYADKTVPGVQVAENQSVTENVTLSSVPSVTVSGTVADGSGHGWPLPATVGALDTPVSVTTDPATGRYSMSLPSKHTYTLRVTAQYNGYGTAEQPVTVGDGDMQQNVSMEIDSAQCVPGSSDVLGYALPGGTQTFDKREAPEGWTVTGDASSTQTWRFDNPSGEENITHTIGNVFYTDRGNFASVDVTDLTKRTKPVDTTLTSPATDMSGFDAPTLKFDTKYWVNFFTTASVDVSTDGGQTWATVWKHSRDPGNTVGGGFWVGPQTVPLPQAAGQHDVRVRFHYTGKQPAVGRSAVWQVDNVFLGSATCKPTPSGLVIGKVSDKNTGDALNRATVTGGAAPVRTGPSTFGPLRAVGDGFYATAVLAGQQQVTASMPRYADQPQSVEVKADQVTTADFSLASGRLSVSKPAAVTSLLGGAVKTTTTTLTNTGSAPVTATVHGGDGGATLQAASRAQAAGPGDAWTRPPDAPMAVTANAVATDPDTGIVYSAGGVWNYTLGTTATTALFAYDPSKDAWDTSLPDFPLGPSAKVASQATFVDGKMYMVGGWDSPDTMIYSPRTSTWTQGAPIPKDYGYSSVATLNGRVYVIGGCTAQSGSQGSDGVSCGKTDVQVYDPASGHWSTAADYPEPITRASCGAISGEIYCAGGASDDIGIQGTTHGYVYNPQTDQWGKIPDLPAAAYDGVSGAANGKLLVSGGTLPPDAYGEVLTSPQGYAYDPAAKAWSPLPDAINPTSGGGSACGMYSIGGSPFFRNIGYSATSFVKQLPGYGACDGDTGVSWMSVKPAGAVTVQPGQSVTVTLSVDPSDASVTQPGTYTAHLGIDQNTPYDVDSPDLTANFTAPDQWAKITGTVTGVDCFKKLAPLAGATVQIQSKDGLHTLTTDADGHFALWVDRSKAPFSLLAGADTWHPQARNLPLSSDQTTVDLTLNTRFPCTSSTTGAEVSR